MGTYVRCGRNKVIVIIFGQNSDVLRPHGGVQGKHYTLMDLPLYGEQIELSPIFVASFSREL